MWICGVTKKFLGHCAVFIPERKDKRSTSHVTVIYQVVKDVSIASLGHTRIIQLFASQLPQVIFILFYFYVWTKIDHIFLAR